MYEIEKSDKEVFKIYGLFHAGSDAYVAYGTGRYILQFGFSHVEGNFFQSNNQDGAEFDDDLIITPLWIQNSKGTIVPEPIYDIGEYYNWCSTVSKICRKKKP